MASRPKSIKKEPPPVFSVGDLARCYAKRDPGFIEGEVTETKNDEVDPDEISDDELDELIEDTAETGDKKKRRRPMVHIFDERYAWFFWVPAAACIRLRK